MNNYLILDDQFKKNHTYAASIIKKKAFLLLQYQISQNLMKKKLLWGESWPIHNAEVDIYK